jgi:hypothetical protein
MKKADPFTTDSARVAEQPTDARIQREGAAAVCDAWQIFGKLGKVEFKKYFGLQGVWRCGFDSFFGFHTRGTGETARAAVEMASRSRLPDDPSPSSPSWVPGSYKDPYTPHQPPAPAAPSKPANLFQTRDGGLLAEVGVA